MERQYAYDIAHGTAGKVGTIHQKRNLISEKGRVALLAFFIYSCNIEKGYPYGMIIKVLQMISILVAAGILGNWYLSEYRRIRATDLPWYRAYLTLPGIILIIVIFLLPMIARNI